MVTFYSLYSFWHFFNFFCLSLLYRYRWAYLNLLKTLFYRSTYCNAGVVYDTYWLYVAGIFRQLGRYKVLVLHSASIRNILCYIHLSSTQTTVIVLSEVVGGFDITCRHFWQLGYVLPQLKWLIYTTHWQLYDKTCFVFEIWKWVKLVEQPWPSRYRRWTFYKILVSNLTETKVALFYPKTFYCHRGKIPAPSLAL